MTRLSDVILPTFFDFWKATKLAYTFYVAKGGRNSSKSTTISIVIILGLIAFPINALAIRKVAATLQDSVYEQLKEATILLGVTNEFKFGLSPLKITYLERGNYILFRGVDKPEKLKSIKSSQFPIAWIWIEEITEFKTEEEIQVVIDSILREALPDGIAYKFFFSYNPPKRKQHWVNKKYETQFIDKDTYVHSSDYRGNHYLSKQTLFSIELMRKKNYRKYEWIYLGKPIGGGVVPFDNLVFRRISDEEIKSFDTIRQGLDWGYAVDPLAFGRWHYDRTRRKVYLFDEIYGVQLSNKWLANELISRKYHRDLITADSEDPKSIAELQSYGINIKKAKKGPGSREYGEKWLNDLEEIIIDPYRCPNAAREFESIDYQIDKDGNLLPKLEEKDDHTIDMGRYTFEDDMMGSTWLFA